MKTCSYSTLETRHIRSELNEAYREEEEYWLIKNRNHWLQAGDRHTQFFYAATKTRIARNKIHVEEGYCIHRGELEIGRTAETDFTNFFSSSCDTSKDYSSAFENFQGNVTKGINDALTKYITEDEIRKCCF